MQLRQVFFPSVDDLLLMRGRLVAQFPVMTSDTELFHQAERGKQFGLGENRFRKDFLIEKIQAPRPEPDEIDQENRECDDNDRRDSEKPLQQALEHVLHQRVNGERVNENFAAMGSAQPALSLAEWAPSRVNAGALAGMNFTNTQRTKPVLARRQNQHARRVCSPIEELPRSRSS
jgi:hypothetical protein